jgi:N-acetylated-alpha-linked acidic dipeptidase
LLLALNGHGPKAASIGWKDGGLEYKGVGYNIGPSPDHLSVNLVNEQEYVTTPLWNVIGIINGSIPDEVVVLGNHRDAWIAGGASDPNSGSAAFNEVIRSFGVALRAGWKPLRTIVFASWDGEEYGLVGSTEWVEEYLPWLSASIVAYLNVDVGTKGPDFRLSAAPLLEKVVIDAGKHINVLISILKAKRITVELVQSPNQTVPGQTVGDVWDKYISTMGSGSDFTAFQDFAGIPSLDMGFGDDSRSAVYHYHSNYDSFSWMEKYGDPSFQYHETIAKIWALVAATLVETPVLPLNATRYAQGLRRYVDSVKDKARHESFPTHDSFDDLFSGLDAAVARFHFAATIQDGTAAALLQQLIDDAIPWWHFWEKLQLYYAVRRVNTKYKLLERQFLYKDGLDGRSWFKHVVFAPGKWTGYAGATFPGIVEGIEERDADKAVKWVTIATEALDAASDWLEGE